MKPNQNEMFKERSSSRKNALLRGEQQKVETRRHLTFEKSGKNCLSCRLRPTIVAEHAHKKQQSAYHNGAIGNIKRRPVVSADVKIQKVRDLALREAVPEIAYGPAQNQRESQSSGVEVAAVSPQQNRNHGQSCHGKGDQQGSPER